MNNCKKCKKNTHGTSIKTKVGKVCMDCVSIFYYMCSTCNKYKSNGACIYVQDDTGRKVKSCPSCVKANKYMKCGHCGRLTMWLSTTHIKDGVCHECHYSEYERKFDKVVNPYSWKPTPIFKHHNGMKVVNGLEPISNRDYYGWELELESNNNRYEVGTKIITDNPTLIYLKNDVSIIDGFEMITHPMTWGYINNYSWGKVFKHMHNMHVSEYSENSNGDVTSGGCGMHVNVSRHNLTPLTMFKLSIFINEYKKFTLLMSGRDVGALNRWAKLSARTHTETLHNIKHGKFTMFGRRGAVSFADSNRLEVRIFKASTRYKEVMKNLEFVRSLIEYSNMTSLDGMSLKGYLSHLSKKKFKNLNAFLAKNGAKVKTTLRNPYIVPRGMAGFGKAYKDHQKKRHALVEGLTCV